MPLYHLNRTEFEYDADEQALIRAPSETMAREIAELMLVSGKNGIWLDASTTCTRIECEGEYGVVFKASHPG